MLKKLFTILLTTVFTSAFVLSAISPASALGAGDIVVQINPASQEIGLVPGETLDATLKVQNIGRLGFNFTLSTKPFQVKDESYDPDFSTANDYTKLQNWVHFEQTEYYLEAGTEIEVPYQIVVPLDAPGGGQYAAIIVETRDGSDPNATVRTVAQLASTIYAQVDGDIRNGGELVSHSLPTLLLGAPFTVSATVKDTGNTDFRVRHALTIYDFFTGNEVFNPDSRDDAGETPGQATPIVLPGTQRTSELTWAGAPQLGVFRVVQTISFLEQEYTYEQLVFLCPIWLVVLVTFFIGLLIFWIILRIRKHRLDKRHSGVV